MGLFLDCFGELPDPRRGNARRHDLLELLTIALSATLCGAASCVDFELFARSKEEFLREFLSLEGGVPSHDTFSRLFRLLGSGRLLDLPDPVRGRPVGGLRRWARGA